MSKRHVHIPREWSMLYCGISWYADFRPSIFLLCCVVSWDRCSNNKMFLNFTQPLWLTVFFSEDRIIKILEAIHVLLLTNYILDSEWQRESYYVLQRRVLLFCIFVSKNSFRVSVLKVYILARILIENWSYMDQWLNS